jgi:hypothetical protein
MVMQDVFAVLMCQAENRGAGWRAGCLDACMWICAITTNHYALNTLNGHSLVAKALIVAAVTAANIGGSKLGQWTGDRFFPDANKAKLTRLEAWAKQQGFSG